jgi:hypothetical protein
MSEKTINELVIILNNLTEDVKELKSDFKKHLESNNNKNIQCVEHSGRITNIEKELKELKENRKWLQRTIISTALVACVNIIILAIKVLNI